jgi:TDG/mug DNA glycosylase family protein
MGQTGAVPDEATIEVYQRSARDWAGARRPQDADHVAWVDRHRRPGPVADLGCGPGWNLTALAPPRIALDAAGAMLELVADHAPGTARVLAGVERLPFASRSLGGAVANRVLLHLRRHDVPLALADLHRALAPDGPAFVRVMGHPHGLDRRAGGPFAGRLFSAWAPGEFEEVCRRAGFTVVRAERGATDVDWATTALRVRLRRAATLPDTVGPDMRLLVCGLNPSPYAVEAGVGFARPGNRFWPAALAAGLVTADRDPFRALLVDRIGMTDLVKRVTRRADELEAAEYREGLARLDRLVGWLRPRAVCVVGLAGWRAATDRSAVAGIQERVVGGRPVYLMPSTSGLNANATPADLADHLRAAARLAAAS